MKRTVESLGERLDEQRSPAKRHAFPSPRQFKIIEPAILKKAEWERFGVAEIAQSRRSFPLK